MCKLQSSMVLMSDEPSESEAHCRSIPGKSLQFVPWQRCQEMIALIVTLRLEKDGPSTHQIFLVDVWFI
jgi:hypothetical protein